MKNGTGLGGVEGVRAYSRGSRKLRTCCEKPAGPPAHTQSCQWAGVVPGPANLHGQTRILTWVWSLTRDWCPEKQIIEEKGSGEGRLQAERKAQLRKAELTQGLEFGSEVQRARPCPSVLAADCGLGSKHWGLYLLAFKIRGRKKGKSKKAKQ